MVLLPDSEICGHNQHQIVSIIEAHGAVFLHGGRCVTHSQGSLTPLQAMPSAAAMSEEALPQLGRWLKSITGESLWEHTDSPEVCGSGTPVAGQQSGVIRVKHKKRRGRQDSQAPRVRKVMRKKKGRKHGLQSETAAHESYHVSASTTVGVNTDCRSMQSVLAARAAVGS